MKLSELIKNTEYKTISGPDVEIQSLGHNSSQISTDMLFFCISGTRADGHEFAVDAVKKGAVAIVTERVLPIKIPQVLVQNSRRAMAELASAFYGNPAKKLKLIGISGTNGKTTTTYIIKRIAEEARIKAGIIGTSGIVIGEKILPPLLTTPDPIDLHRTLREMVDNGMEWVAMEVSAHALDLHKLSGIIFDIAVFTNFSQDHLDYFETLEDYKNTKMSFYSPEYCKCAVINIDDEVGREIVRRAKIPIYTYGIENPSDVFAIDYEADENGQKYIINSFDDIAQIDFRMPGRFNEYNTLCSATVCQIFNIPLCTIAHAISQIQTIPGRFNVINCGSFSAIIDYAHTPDGLRNILDCISEFCKGRIITVFGCGGNRDRSKRAHMGWIVAKKSSYTIVTSDNPRYEHPLDIISDIEEGIIAAQSSKYMIMENRKDAIKYALRIAQKQDIVLIAGKGDEPYQDIMGKKIAYNDLEVVEEFLATR